MNKKPTQTLGAKDIQKYHIKRYQFSLPMFCNMFKVGNEINLRVKEGWPKDARIVGLHSDEKTYSFTVLVASEEFDAVRLDGELPTGEVWVEEKEESGAGKKD